MRSSHRNSKQEGDNSMSSHHPGRTAQHCFVSTLVLARVGMHVCTCGGQRIASGFIPQEPSSSKLTDLSRLVGRWAPGSQCLCLSRAGISRSYHLTWHFLQECLGTVFSTLCLSSKHFTDQALSPASHTELLGHADITNSVFCLYPFTVSTVA